MKKAIIQSLLDTDFYKLTMGQFAWRRYPDVPVKYAFKNRTTSVPLGIIIPEEELRFEFDHLMSISLSEKESNYLADFKKSNGDPIFCNDYLQFFGGLQLPEYNLKRIGDYYEIEFPGKWSEAIYWETPALSIIDELYYRKILKIELFFILY